MKHCKLFSLLMLLSFPAAGQKQPVKTSETDSCTQSPILAQLSKGSGAAVLNSYGYNLREPWACARIHSPWVTGSVLLRFQKVSAETDGQTAFSVLKVSNIEHIWVVPTGTGMLEVPHAESDPHNIAAFNALLSSLRKPPLSNSDWDAVGKLYMTMLGHKDAVQVAPEAGDTAVCNGDGECTVAFSDRPVRPGEAFNKWTLVFAPAGGGKPAMLEEATRETVPGRR
jgi:hypothetical protein